MKAIGLHAVAPTLAWTDGTLSFRHRALSGARLIAGFSVLAAISLGWAQQTRILSLEQNGVLTWSNSQIHAYCGLEFTEQLPAGWESAPSPYWNMWVTNPVMSVALPFSPDDSGPLFFRLVSSLNPLPEPDSYDVDANGLPRFVSSNYIELNKIERISRFRSGEGHDYSDDFESCRSMKHYFQPAGTVDWASVLIRSPVTGTVTRLRQEWGGTQIRIKSADFPAFYFILFHVQLGAFAVGDSVSAGQVLGTHVGSQTMSDIAVEVNTPRGVKLVSYFEVITDSLFDVYANRGMTARTDAIIGKEDRDADPLHCDGETFASPGNIPNWVTLR